LIYYYFHKRRFYFSDRVVPFEYLIWQQQRQKLRGPPGNEWCFFCLCTGIILRTSLNFNINIILLKECTFFVREIVQIPCYVNVLVCTYTVILWKKNTQQPASIFHNVYLHIKLYRAQTNAIHILPYAKYRPFQR